MSIDDLRGRITQAITPRNADVTWMRDAACVGAGNAESWFPNTDHGNHGEYLFAKRICGTCAVRLECLAWALEKPELHGCWGGTSPGERYEIRRGQREGAA